ncbi:hypothetical protein LUZ60_003126 [Juncus effusus]|nr:hypothetical protein LUZ60_003126 [Juncus effusus]
MAKARRQKNEEQKPESLGCVLLHQKLCLSIDMLNKTIFGYTELKVLLRESEQIPLHADNLTIESITVDGEEMKFEYSPQFQDSDDDRRFSSVECSNSAADVASSLYISSLAKEELPNLIVYCKNSEKLVNGKLENGENGGEIDLKNSEEQTEKKVTSSSEEQAGEENNGHSEEKIQNEKLVRIDYSIEKAETGIHFTNNILHTNNQIKRSHCWFPCMYSLAQCCTFDLEITVSSEFLAVSNGTLLYQVLTKDDPPKKTFVYELNTPITAQHISLVVAPLEVQPDDENNLISHFCLSPYLSKLQNTISFFHTVYSCYEEYLGVKFPFGCYKQIFLPSEILISSASFGASICVFSSDLLYDERVLDQIINTRIKLAYAFAKQWFGEFVTAEEPTDEWLLDGLAGFLTDNYIKRFLGNNEARYRRYKANCAVCKLDVSGATALSSIALDLYGTQSIGLYGKIRSWKAVAVLQMLEKQMGPDSFRKILQMIVGRELGSSRSRKISTKEFRHLVNKVGNLERPFLKEFFPRWVESHGCPLMTMGVSYNKRRNLVELAVSRDSTSSKDNNINNNNNNINNNEGGETGWPGMMTVRVHELDMVYDHPMLPLSGDSWQVVEVQCHSKLSAKRAPKPKKATRPDGSDDNAAADVISSQQDTPRAGMDSPLLWIRVDPEMEYLAEIHFHQPILMWINQLEKDKDVVAQSQAIQVLEKLPQLSFSVVNALTNFINDSKAFWRVRIEAAYTLAITATEETDLAGLLNLVKFYKSRRFDPDIGLPRPNDFRDVAEYFVLEAIPHAVALGRASDKKSPREAIEFILQLLKYNDNNGNPYSDVHWLAAMVQAIGELEFSQQSIVFLTSLLKRIDRLLQLDSFMPNYNGVLTISCIRALAQIALKMSTPFSVGHIYELIKPFRSNRNPFKVRIEASRVLLDLEFHYKGLDQTFYLFFVFLNEEPSLRGESKLAMHIMHLCEASNESKLDNQISRDTLINLIDLLTSRKSYNNMFLRHHLFCILQITARRSPTLYGIPKPIPPTPVQEKTQVLLEAPTQVLLEASLDVDPQPLEVSGPPPQQSPIEISADTPKLPEENKTPQQEPSREHSKTNSVSQCSERKSKSNVVKIRVRQSSSKLDETPKTRDTSAARVNENEAGPCSSVSVDAPAKTPKENIDNNNNNENNIDNNNNEGNSFHEITTNSVASANKEEIRQDNNNNNEVSNSFKSPVTFAEEVSNKQEHQSSKEKRKKEKKDKKRKQREDPEYLERKRLKKEKKKEKERAKKESKAVGPASTSEPAKPAQSVSEPVEPVKPAQNVVVPPPVQPQSQSVVVPKIRIKIKGLGLGK